MRNSKLTTGGWILGLAILAAMTAPAMAQETATIVVQPKTIAISSHDGSVSVHTNIVYSSCTTGWTAYLNGDLQAYAVGSDLSGDLVAKFDIFTVKSWAAGSLDTQILVTFTAVCDGVTWTGTDTLSIVTSKKKV